MFFFNSGQQNDARMNLIIALTAIRKGATCLNQVEVLNLLKKKVKTGLSAMFHVCLKLITSIFPIYSSSEYSYYFHRRQQGERGSLWCTCAWHWHWWRVGHSCESSRQCNWAFHGQYKKDVWWWHSQNLPRKCRSPHNTAWILQVCFVSWTSFDTEL